MSSESTSTTPCPKCAVAVPLGYVKCPRCHATMPSQPPRARRESMRDAVAGGTSVPEPESGGFPWLYAGVCAAAATAAVVWYVSSGGARATEPGAAADAPGAPALAASAVPSAVEPLPGEPAPSPPAVPAVDPRPRERADAVAALAHALATDRLWATVDAIGDAVVIRSSFCADPGIAGRVDAVRAKLGGLGFHAARCLEKAGAPVWQRDLP